MLNDRYNQRRSTYEENYRALENLMKPNGYMKVKDRNETNDFCPQNEEPSYIPDGSRRSNINSYRNTLTKNREIAKLKAIIYQKDNEFLALATTHKNALLKIEERMERERKVWNDHKELRLSDERAKFEEEKAFLIQDFQYKLHLERERCQQLELQLKESDRERTNTIYRIKVQYRQEYENEIIRLNEQYQTEKNMELTRLQERVQELEQTVNHLSDVYNDSNTVRQQLYNSLDVAEKTCVRSINDAIKTLLLTMNRPSHVYTAIPNVSSFIYDEAALFERKPTRILLKYLLRTIEEIRDHVGEQRVTLENQTMLLEKPKISTDRRLRSFDENSCQDQTNSYSKSSKDNSAHPTSQTSTRPSHTVDSLLQKLEDHIGLELNRLSKQRATSSLHLDGPEKIDCEFNSENEINQDKLIRHLQNRINDLRSDNMRLRDNQHSKSISSSYDEIKPSIH
ncbi:unnamed protein product [Adineta ricciae]|uniref:Uncharacterized protein n=1 Tax=Adineta ricciae TaxID=249248 RepID=A0A816APB0_ADIRI|nr:unnamed protein product [Adineta ricciae]